MSRRKTILVAVLSLVAFLAAYLLFWPVKIDPVAWTPPASPERVGIYQQNDALAGMERLDIGGKGPEDVAIDTMGRIYGGLEDGRIMRRDPEGAIGEFADTGGRPLGLAFDGQGNLLVADADKGLLSLAPSGAITVLTTSHGDRPFRFTDDVDIASDGKIYFSDASDRWTREHLREEFLEHKANGRLLVYDPATRTTELLLDQLYFANGVAVAADDSYVLVNETSAYRITRYWLKGDKAGTSEILIDNLPGLPDGISRGTSGRFWVALYSTRLADLDSLMPRPWLRKVVYRLPRFLQPEPVRHGFALAIDAQGNVVANLQDPAADSFSPITSVEESGVFLYFGSLSYAAVGRMPVPEL